MPATIVVGGQYGSEGKGKVVALLANSADRPWLVRCGGPNSGHTVTIDGKDVIMRQVPSCAKPNGVTFCIAAGCVVDESLLLRELEMLKIERGSIIVDPRAVFVTAEDRDAESRDLGHIGSTCSGTGAALQRRMSRRFDIRLVAESEDLRGRCRIESVAPLLHRVHDDGGNIIVEGTQGFGLSLLHGPDYPYVTSRDTTAAGFAAEVGLSPRHVENIMMVIRTFPIRVGGTSGPFPNEISWQEIQTVSGAPEVLAEYTSVTKRLRRVARFDLDAVRIACSYNRPTGLAVMGLDRLDYANTGVTESAKLSAAGRKFLDALEMNTGVPVQFIGTGFGTFDAITVTTTSRHTEAAHV
ncbi:MAG TPA: adenylosuccinate synthetase [Candidatus Binatia bacterium]|jgi:adenylosuccinate synthase|nr:adenylosuccinate synthetase [Candidatus Binatia bacterium]